MNQKGVFLYPMHERLEWINQQNKGGVRSKDVETKHKRTVQTKVIFSRE